MLGPSKIMPGSKFPPDDLKYVQDNNIIVKNEKILYFYSTGGAFFHLWTDKASINYTKNDRLGNDVQRINYEEMEKIEIEYKSKGAKNSAVTIYIKDGGYSASLLSRDDKTNEVFYKTIMDVWRKINK